MRPRRLAVGSCAFLALAGVFARPAEPCTRVLWNDGGRSVLVGRTMDWFQDLRTEFWSLPRGMKRDGLAAKNPLGWASRFGSLAVVGNGGVTADGVNEKGLAVHMLYLPETRTGARDEAVPGLCVSLWAQYYLDGFATVAEAVDALKTSPYQLLMATDPVSGKAATVHLALDDPTGDSAVLECLEGTIRVHHGRRFTVMTNEPAYDRQLENLKRYQGQSAGGPEAIPGPEVPADRFVRCSVYAANFPKPATDRDALATILSLMRNVSMPIEQGTPERPNWGSTLWRTVTDLSRGVLYYDGGTVPQFFRVDTHRLNFDESAPVRKLAIEGHPDLDGEVSGQFVDAPMFRFLKPE